MRNTKIIIDKSGFIEVDYRDTCHYGGEIRVTEIEYETWRSYLWFAWQYMRGNLVKMPTRVRRAEYVFICEGSDRGGLWTMEVKMGHSLDDMMGDIMDICVSQNVNLIVVHKA